MTKEKKTEKKTENKKCGFFSCLFPWIKRKKDRTQLSMVPIDDYVNEGQIIADTLIEDILDNVFKVSTDRPDSRFDSLESLNLNTLFGFGDGALQKSTPRETVTVLSLEEEENCRSGSGDIVPCCASSSVLLRNKYENSDFFGSTQDKFQLEVKEEIKSLNGSNDSKNICASTVIEIDENDQMTATSNLYPMNEPMNFQTSSEHVQSADNNSCDNKHNYLNIPENMIKFKEKNNLFPRLTKLLTNLFRSKKKNL